MSSNQENFFDYGYYLDEKFEAFKKFGGIFDLPISRKGAYFETIRTYEHGNILDLGAGKNKALLKIIGKKVTNGKYYSLDNDPKGTFDFNEFSDIPDDLGFSLIVANQFFEHLEVKEAFDIMLKVQNYLIHGGKLFATIPNILHPTRYFANITHKTWWSYASLYMVFKYANLEITDIKRYSKRHPKGPIERIIARYVSKIYRMDWCDSVLMIGEKR